MSPYEVHVVHRVTHYPASGVDAPAIVLPQNRRTTWNPGLNPVGGIPTITSIDSMISPLSPAAGNSATITIGASATVAVGVTVNSGQAFVFALNGDILGQSGGTLPSGISIGTDYYALSTGTSFTFATSPGGTAVTTSGSLSGSLSICLEDGVNINNAISAAGTRATAGNLLVVKLNAGVYRIGAQTVVLHSPYVTLRGAGPGVGLNTGISPIAPAVFQTSGTFVADSAATQLVKCNRPLNDGNPVMFVGFDANFANGTTQLGSSINLATDAVKDAFSCTLASNPGISVGEVVLIDINTDSHPDVFWGIAHSPAMATFTGSITSNVLSVTAMSAGSLPISTNSALTVSGGGLTIGTNHIVAQLTGDVYGVTISIANPCVVTLNSGTLASLGITANMPFTFQNSGGSLPQFQFNGNASSAPVFYVVPTGPSTFNFKQYPESAQPLCAATGTQSGTQSIAFGSATGVLPCTYSVDNSPANVSSQTLTAVGGTRRQFGRQDRSISQLMEVAAVNGNTITFVTPFHATFSVANQAQLSRFDPGNTPLLSYVGIEELFVWGGLGGNISCSHLAYSWIKHVESVWSVGDAISVGGCYRCTVRDSFAHETPNPAPGGGGYRMGFSLGSSDCLVENCISWCGNKVVVFRGGGSGNVFGYNYMDDSFGASYPDSPEAGLNFGHMATPCMNLAEGNYSHNYKADAFWGASIDLTCHRNQFSALRAAHTPLNTYNSTSPFKPYGDYINRIAVDVQAHSYRQNFIGNILGLNGQSLLSYNANGYGPVSQPGFLYENFDAFDVSDNVIMWKFGEEQDPNGSVWVGDTYTTMLRQGNWDWFTQQQRWHGTGGRGASDSSQPLPIPNSYYLTAKPAFFNNHPWPWVHPENGETDVLPAKARFNTSNPNDLTV